MTRDHQTYVYSDGLQNAVAEDDEHLSTKSVMSLLSKYPHHIIPLKSNFDNISVLGWASSGWVRCYLLSDNRLMSDNTGPHSWWYQMMDNQPTDPGPLPSQAIFFQFNIKWSRLMCAKISPDPSHNPISDGDRVCSTAVPCREGPAWQTAVNTVQCQLGEATDQQSSEDFRISWPLDHVVEPESPSCWQHLPPPIIFSSSHHLSPSSPYIV